MNDVLTFLKEGNRKSYNTHTLPHTLTHTLPYTQLDTGASAMKRNNSATELQLLHKPYTRHNHHPSGALYLFCSCFSPRTHALFPAHLEYHAVGPRSPSVKRIQSRDVLQRVATQLGTAAAAPRDAGGRTRHLNLSNILCCNLWVWSCRT